MTDKAYIVTNEQQEREVLGKLERGGAEWGRSKSKPTDFIPSHVNLTTKLPYALLVENDQISWCDIEALYEFDDIVYDGRKEERMSDNYVVSQEFMNKLEEWKETLRLDNVSFIGCRALSNLPTLLDNWWRDGSVSVYESNNRLIAIIRWVNGEDVFEVEKPKKWVVRSRIKDLHDDHWYVALRDEKKSLASVEFSLADATKFDTKEEAESWANSHQEVVEVEG